MIGTNKLPRPIALLIAVTVAVSANAKELVMRSPPATIQQGERPLSKNEVGELSCTTSIRRTVSATPGIDMASETVTHSDKAGYIYRYEINQLMEEGSHTYRSIFVVWTSDCKTWQIATHPIFRLPG